MRHLLTIGLIFLLTNYNNLDSQNSHSVKQKNNRTESDFSDAKTNSITIFETKFPPPVDIKKLKRLSFLTTTSGVLPHTESKDLCRPNTKGFFGHYQLINKKEFAFIGQLSVFTTDQPQNWKYDNDNETFAEIKLVSSDINVWDSIGVGTNEKEVMKFIGNNFHYKKGTLLYCELGDYSANFTIIGDTVNKLTIGKYCKDKK